MTIDHVVGFKCMLCGATYAPGEISYVCPLHGDDGIVDVLYDYDRIKSRISREALRTNPESTMWRYKPLLPVEPAAVVPPLRVGWTPLYRAPRLGAPLGLNDLWVKDDGVNPTGSFKDRASALAVVKAEEAGARVVIVASTGNAAAAMAGLGASVGMKVVIFVPKSAPLAKITQHLVYGARVLLIDGTYDDAFDLALAAGRRYGWYVRNTAYNPYMTEGKKTAAYEMCERLDWQAPDAIFVPVGDGCIIGGIHKGLKDLQALGWIDRMPRLIGVQAEGSAALVDAFERGLSAQEMRAMGAETVADSICACLPRDRAKALAAVRETGGSFLAVGDDEILAAIPEVARKTGVFCEPAAAASYAGLVRAVERGLVAPDERTVLLLTGSGLKDAASAMKAVPAPPTVPPDVEAACDALTAGI